MSYLTTVKNKYKITPDSGLVGNLIDCSTRIRPTLHIWISKEI